MQVSGSENVSQVATESSCWWNGGRSWWNGEMDQATIERLHQDSQYKWINRSGNHTVTRERAQHKAAGVCTCRSFSNARRTWDLDEKKNFML